MTKRRPPRVVFLALVVLEAFWGEFSPAAMAQARGAMAPPETFNDTTGGADGNPIASITPLASAYGPTEAGKRSGDRVVATVADASGAPVAGARWRIETDDRSGWVYPAQGTTGAAGRISATWVAGSPGAGVLTVTAEKAASSMTVELATESVPSPRAPKSAVNVPMRTDRATGYAIDLTPLAEPGGTYYAAIQWDGGYTGLQRGGSRYDRQLQFSVWDANGLDARIIGQADDVVGDGRGKRRLRGSLRHDERTARPGDGRRQSIPRTRRGKE